MKPTQLKISTKQLFIGIAVIGLSGCGTLPQALQPPDALLQIIPHARTHNDLVLMEYVEPEVSVSVNGEMQTVQDAVSVDFFVVFHNNTDGVMYVTEDNHEIGRFCLVLYIQRKDGTVYRIQRLSTLQYRRMPYKIEVLPHSSLAIPISLDNRIWENMPKLADGEEYFVKAEFPSGWVIVNEKCRKALPETVVSPFQKLLFRKMRFASPETEKLIVESKE